MVSLNQEDKRIHDLAYLYLPHEQASPEEVKLLRAAYRAGYREGAEASNPCVRDLLEVYEKQIRQWRARALVTAVLGMATAFFGIVTVIVIFVLWPSH